MITYQNYYKLAGNLNFSELPEVFQKAHELVNKTTSGGQNWNDYHASETLQKVFNDYFGKLSAHLDSKAESLTPSTKEKKQKGESSVRKTPIQKDIKKSFAKQDKLNNTGKATTEKTQDTHVTFVERIPEELRFIKRFVNMDGKTKTSEEILRFINSLQKAILEKRVRKTSVYADHIRNIQSLLIQTFQQMGSTIKIRLKPETYQEYTALSSQEQIHPIITYIKRYISLNGKPGMKKKADLLARQINKAFSSEKISSRDHHFKALKKVWDNLVNFVQDPKIKTLQIEPSELSGLNGIMGHSSINGYEMPDDNEDNNIDGTDQPRIMNSMDFAKLKFSTIGLTGKWLKLIGDPSKNFTAMVFGRPKVGKSYLCLDFAGYLARNHGKVLYVAKEEGLDYTLQDKINDPDVMHPNLTVADDIPDSLDQFDFIFLDSVNKLGLKPKDLELLKKYNPSKSFIFIFQTTKQGNFRGANQYQHDVDVVIEVPERGKAVQYGRFNQGGEMNIFSE